VDIKKEIKWEFDFGREVTQRLCLLTFLGGFIILHTDPQPHRPTLTHIKPIDSKFQVPLALCYRNIFSL